MLQYQHRSISTVNHGIYKKFPSQAINCRMPSRFGFRKAYALLKAQTGGMPAGDARQPAGTVRSGRTSRLADRHLGRMVLRGIKLVRRPRPLPVAPKEVALCVLGALGDTLLASVLAQDIRRVLPGVRITLIAAATNQAMAPLLPEIDGLLVIPVNRPDRAVRLIRRARFDLLIDCNQWLRISAIHAALAGCFSIGFRTAGQHRHQAFDRTVDHLATRHELENYRALLTPLGIEAQAVPAVQIPPEAHAAVAPLLSSAGDGTPGKGTIVFHPWAGGGNAWLKEWPLQSWISLAHALQGQGFGICVTGGPGDAANMEQLMRAAAARNVTMRPVAGTLTLIQIAALLSRAQAVVAVNTGIMHLTAAVNKRLVALHGPTNPARWGPLCDGASVIVPDGVPSAYLHLGFEFPKRVADCMSAIPVATVLNAVMRVLDAA